MSGTERVGQVPDFHGKIAIVTGAASGIGRATAAALAEAGAQVTLVDVADEAGIIAARDVGGTYVHLDVSQPAAWSQVLADFGHIDYLHLNAGIYDIELTDITKITDQRYRAYTGVNIDGVFLGLRAAVPLLERSGGAVVVTASVAGLVPLPTNPLYSLTKFALVGLVRSVHGDLRRRNIRLNGLCPGAVATHIMGSDPHAWYEEHGVPAFEPEDLAATVLELLASDSSGQILLQVPPGPARVLDFPTLAEL